MKKFKEKAFGSTTKTQIKATHNFFPSAKKLKEKLSPEGEIKVFCLGCGSYHEFKKGSVSHLGLLLTTKMPEDLSDYFFETLSCYACDSERQGGRLRKIEEVEEN